MHPHGDCVWAGAPREVMEANTRCVRTDAGSKICEAPDSASAPAASVALQKKGAVRLLTANQNFTRPELNKHAKLTWGWEAGVFTRGETWPFYETYKAQILDASKTITL